MYDPSVHVHKTVLMQRLLDAVIRGYCWHTSGTVPVQKAWHLAEKFARCYDVHLNVNQRAYAKRMGKSNSRLFLYAPPDSDSFLWWLLVTAGDGVVHREERLDRVSATRNRLRVGDDYELVRRTRASNKGGGTVWTWRMTSTCISQWRERIIYSCRRPDSFTVTQAIGSLYRTPGFSGNRVQVGKLVALARAEWLRRHGTLDAFILPPALPYVERLSDTNVMLSELCSER